MTSQTTAMPSVPLGSQTVVRGGLDDLTPSSERANDLRGAAGSWSRYVSHAWGIVARRSFFGLQERPLSPSRASRDRATSLLALASNMNDIFLMAHDLACTFLVLTSFSLAARGSTLLFHCTRNVPCSAVGYPYSALKTCFRRTDTIRQLTLDLWRPEPYGEGRQLAHSRWSRVNVECAVIEYIQRAIRDDYGACYECIAHLR